MTLSRSKPEGTRPVIDRNDDSVTRPIRVGVVAAPGLFTDVLINALLGSRIAAWRLPGNAPEIRLRDDDRDERPDLVLFVDAPDARPQRFTDRGLPVMLLEERAGIAGASMPTAAVTAVDPRAADLDQLVAMIHQAAGDRVTSRPNRRRQIDAARRRAQADYLESVSIINSDDATA